MPTGSGQEVTTCADNARKWTFKRDEAIRKMRAEGSSLRAIAQAAGLTHGAVAKIIKKESK